MKFFTFKNIILIVLAAVVVYFAYQQFFANRYELPDSSAPSREATVTINDQEIDVMETEEVKHSIPLNEILGGGPPKDGIPSIDDPHYVSVNQVPEWLEGDAEGISFVQGDTERFYPFPVLVRHEIVNDTVNGQRVLVTYCPLCLTGVVFDPLVDGERVEFGVSGKLWNSNLLMYNRGNPKKESLWSQISGDAVVGELTGAELDVLPSDIVTFDAWRKAHPNGEVLVGENGRVGTYTYIPYGGDLRNIQPFFPVSNEDDRLGENAFVLGLEIDGQFKAYHVDAVRAAGEVIDQFAGKTIVARVDSQEDAVRLYERATDGSEERLNPIPSFWFSWVAVHPETELYQ